jgi:hypothetical protein
MPRLILALLMLSPLLACKDPVRDQCICTLMACFDGVRLQLTGIPDTTRYREFSVAIAYADTVEAASSDWPVFDKNAFTFTSPRLRQQRPAHAEVRIAFTDNGAAKRIAWDTSLAWQASVCNHCSGNSASCQDQMSHSVAMDLDLHSRL